MKYVLLVMGPPGSGKSTAIELLNPATFEYVRPYTTRPIRDSERDKVAVSSTEFQRLQDSGEFAVVNELHGYRYGTPLNTYLKLWGQRKVPVVDWPLGRVEDLRQALPICHVFSVYLRPSSASVIEDRLRSRGSGDLSRMEAVRRELNEITKVGYADVIDLEVVADEGPATIADLIDAEFRRWRGVTCENE